MENTHMKKEVLELVPQWIKDAEYGQYSVMVGDDVDSFATAGLIKKVLDWEINWFYDFHRIYVIDESVSNKNRVGVDMALEFNEKTIDNHVTLLHKDDKPNPNSVNLNAMYKIHRGRYTDKYAMSTLLTAWSLFGLPLPSTNEGKKILLAIDSSFKGHYNSRFKPIHNEWLRKLGFEELIYFLDNKTSFDELDKTIRNRYGLSEKIFLNKKGQLQTRIDLEGIGRYLDLDLKLPKEKFELAYTLKRKSSRLGYGNYSKRKGTYSFALTYRDVASYTIL